MTSVRLLWPVEDERLRGVRVPVTVRTPALALAREAEMPGTIELEPGLYVLSARLPAGQELTRIVHVEAGEPQTVELALDESPLREMLDYLASPREREATVRAAVAAVRHGARKRALWRRWIGRAGYSLVRAVVSSFKGLLPMLSASPAPNSPDFSQSSKAGPSTGPGVGRGGTAPPPGWLRGIAADPLRRDDPTTPIDLDLKVIDRGDDVAELRAGPSTASRYVQILQPGRPPVDIALPTSAEAGCRIVVRREPVRYWVEVQMENAEAALLLGYRRNASPLEEARVAGALLAGGEGSRDPIALTLAAYSCLRFGELERLAPWAEALRLDHPWLPDGATIDGERLAREGEHERALDAFLEAAARGLPRFGDGIDLLHRRLGLYADLPGDFDPERIEWAEHRFERLRTLVGLVDLRQVVTVLTGLDPARPDVEPYTAGPAPEGLDLARLFR